MRQLRSALWFFDQGQKLDMFPDKTENRFSASADRPSCRMATFPEILNPPCFVPNSFRRSLMPWEWYVLGCYPVKNVPNHEGKVLQFKGFLHESFNANFVECREGVWCGVSTGDEDFDIRKLLANQM